jgi:hypothetical protein
VNEYLQITRKGGKMNSYRKNAIVVGILFIIATAAPIMSGPFISSISSPDYLTNVSGNATPVTIGVLLELIMCVAITGTAIGLYPVLKKHNEALALGYVGIRIAEGVLFLVVAITSLALLLTLSQDFVNAGTPVAPYFQSLGALLVGAHDWAYLFAGQLVFSLGALVLNYMLFRSKLVPVFISTWGIIGALLLLAGALLQVFDVVNDTSLVATLIFLPIAVQEMVLAVWLIVKGFNQSAIASVSSEMSG